MDKRYVKKLCIATTVSIKLMKWLLAMVKERGLLVNAISYIYNDKWQKDRIHPGLVGRV